MCGRFALTMPADAMARLFEAQPANDLPDLPDYNICPTDSICAVRSGETGRSLEPMRWGFVPHWAKSLTEGPPLINARAETVAEKPAFREAARVRRCLIPASGFYEWTRDAADRRLPWFIHPPDNGPLVFAGIWQDWERDGSRVRSCAVVTCAANETMGRLHHRMPVILAQTDWAKWLGEAGHGAATLMRPAPEDAVTAYRVDPKVNSNRAAGPDLIAPVTA